MFRIRESKYHNPIGNGAVRNKHLRPINNPLIALFYGSGGGTRRIGTSIWLCNRRGYDPFRRNQFGQNELFLFFAPIELDDLRPKCGRAEGLTDARVNSPKLLCDEAMLKEAIPGTPIILLNKHTQESQLSRLFPNARVKSLFPIELKGPVSKFSDSKLLGCLYDILLLFAQCEIHKMSPNNRISMAC